MVLQQNSENRAIKEDRRCLYKSFAQINLQTRGAHNGKAALKGRLSVNYCLPWTLQDKKDV